MTSRITREKTIAVREAYLPGNAHAAQRAAAVDVRLGIVLDAVGAGRRGATMQPVTDVGAEARGAIDRVIAITIGTAGGARSTTIEIRLGTVEKSVAARG